MGSVLTYSEKSLVDIAEFRNENIKNNQNSDLLYISTSNMRPEKAGIDLTNNDSVGKNGKKFYRGDVLVSNIRPYFKKIWHAKRDGISSPDVLIFRPKEDLYNKRYLYYLLSTDNFFNYMTSTAKGTKMPRGDKEAIKRYTVPDYSENQQLAIANILSPLDNKIDNNNAIIENLKEQAQVIFKSWFVDFEPFQKEVFSESDLGNIPKDWGTTLLENYVDIKYGKDHKKLSDGFYPVYGSGGIMRYVDDCLYNGESVLVPRKGTLNNVMYVNEPFWSVDTMFYTIMKQRNIAKFIYLYLSRVNLKSMNVGSAVPSMTTKLLNNMKVIKPTEKVLMRFESVVNPIFKKEKQLQYENRKLVDLRDTLLPKLIYGEIRVEEAVKTE